MMPTISQTGLRRTSENCRWNSSHVSRASFMVDYLSGLTQRAAGLGQEDVVEARPVQLDGVQVETGSVECPQHLRDRGGTGVDVELHAAVDRLRFAYVGLGLEQRLGDIGRSG